MDKNLTYSLRRNNRNLLLAFVVLLGLVVFVLIIGFFVLKPHKEIIQGQAEGDETRISGKLAGRIAHLYVKEGDNVTAGDTLVAIFSSEAEARLRQVQAMQRQAQAQNQKVDAGTRSQIIQSAFEMWQKALAGKEIAQKTYERIASLYEKGVVASQRLDEVQAQLQAVTATERAAHSQYNLALAGAQTEDKEMAKAVVEETAAGIGQVEAILADSYLVSPIDGQVTEIYPLYGELVGAGAPIMSVLNTENVWVTFNVREELLSNLKMGQILKLAIPACSDTIVDMQIYMIKDMGSYAVWRATKTTGQYDAKTFEVRCRAQSPVEGLRPGMSVLMRNYIINK